MRRIVDTRIPDVPWNFAKQVTFEFFAAMTMMRPLMIASNPSSLSFKAFRTLLAVSKIDVVKRKHLGCNQNGALLIQ
jgi:hypothetical protein